MSYDIKAFVGKEALLIKHTLGFTHARVIPLAQEIALVPLTGPFLQEVALKVKEIPATSLHGFESLSPSLTVWAEQVSRGGTVGYIEAEFFGGMGTQWGIAWAGGTVVAGPYSEDLDAINKVLCLLGVKTTGNADEFDTVGLGRCRNTSAWVASLP